MNKSFLEYYNSELRYLREVGSEFAAKHPKIAGRLQLSEFECQDPYVERLLEGFSFMASRIHHKLDSEFPRFTQALTNTVYPQYNMPSPSFSIISFEPEQDLVDSFIIPRKTVLKTADQPDNKTNCTFTTINNVNILPAKIKSSEYYYDNISSLNLQHPLKKVKSCISIKLQNPEKVNFSNIQMDLLPIYITGSDKEVAMAIYEQIFTKASSLVIRNGCTGEILEVTDKNIDKKIQPYGFDREESLFPIDHRVPNGYRLFREFFDFEEKFMFFNISNLSEAVQKCDSNELEILILLNDSNMLLRKLSRNNFHLYATPIINLFEKELDRVYTNNTKTEINIAADRLHPLDYEIIDIKKATGYNSEYTRETEFFPFFNTDISHRTSFYSLNRRERNLSETENKYGTRTKYKGSEIYLSLIDKDSQPYDNDIEELAVKALCSNRDLPILMFIAQNNLLLKIHNSNYPVSKINLLKSPTYPKPSPVSLNSDWDAINHFSMNYFNINNENKKNALLQLKKALTLYCGSDLNIQNKDINNGIIDINISNITKRIDTSVPVSFVRGFSIEITFDEDEITQKNMMLLSRILDFYFTSNIPINSFAETTVKSFQRGELVIWPLKTGVC
jgi:type VI secretion system protein ImpG